MGPVLIFSSHNAHNPPFFLLNHLFCFSAGWCCQYISINPPKKKNKLLDHTHPHQWPALQPLRYLQQIFKELFIFTVSIFSSAISFHTHSGFFLISCSMETAVKAIICDPMWVNPMANFQSHRTWLFSSVWHSSSLSPPQCTFFTWHPAHLSAHFLLSVHHLSISFAGSPFSNVLMLGYPKVQGLPFYLCSFLWW